MKPLLFCLLVDMRRRLRYARFKLELFALYVQGALTSETFGDLHSRKRPR